MEIVKWDEDMVGLLPNIYKIVSTTLASNKGAIYLVLDEGRLNIFARNGGQGVYVSNKGESVEVSSYLKIINLRALVLVISNMLI